MIHIDELKDSLAFCTQGENATAWSRGCRTPVVSSFSIGCVRRFERMRIKRSMWRLNLRTDWNCPSWFTKVCQSDTRLLRTDTTRSSCKVPEMFSGRLPTRTSHMLLHVERPGHRGPHLQNACTAGCGCGYRRHADRAAAKLDGRTESSSRVQPFRCRYRMRRSHAIGW